MVQEEYEEYDLDDLRLELQRVDILLKDIESAKPPADETEHEGEGNDEEKAGDLGGDGSDNDYTTRESVPASAENGVVDGEKEKSGRTKAGDAREATNAVCIDRRKGVGGTDAEDAATARSENDWMDVDEGDDSKADGVNDDGVGSDADSVSALWAAIAAAAPEATPATGSGKDGEAGEKDGDKEEKDGVWGGVGDSPMAKETAYGSLSVPLRVGILSALCEEYMNDETFRLRVIVSLVCDCSAQLVFSIYNDVLGCCRNAK